MIPMVVAGASDWRTWLGGVNLMQMHRILRCLCAGLALAGIPRRIVAQEDAVTSENPEVGARAARAARKGAGGPNEPIGFTPVSRREFLQRVEEEWTDRGDRAFQIVEDPTAPVSPPFIGRAWYPRGFLAGRGPILTEVALPPKSRGLYLSFWMRLSPNWIGHPSGVNKIFHIWIGGGNRVYLSAHGKGPGPYLPQVNLQGIPGPQIARDLKPLRSHAVLIRRGEWVHWELVFWANRVGEQDGSVEWWINGNRAGRESGLAYVGPKQRAKWETVTWNPTWGGMGGTVPAPMFQDIDEIYVSVSR